jgi:C-terminal processing protease CtpA/Prc
LADPVDRELIGSTVESLAVVVQREYFDPEVGARASESLQKALAEGRYAHALTLQSLADMLTRDLFESTKDKHLAVAVVEDAIVTDESARPLDPSRQERGRHENFGVQRVEVLPGNVGYLNLTSFYRPEEARGTLSAAMRTLQHADSLILDMRANGGGSPETASLLVSYFFLAPELPLFTIVDRSGDARVYATESEVQPERNETRPLYVLTSAKTFSAGEGIAFILQERQRAEIVGEKTAGAANPGRPYRVNSHFEVVVPNGKVVASITGRNWEGSGVTPDVLVPAPDALRVTYARALSKLLSQTTAGPRRDALEGHLKAANASAIRPAD